MRTGTGIPMGIYPRAGTGAGKFLTLTGAGAGEFSPRGDGDGRSIPDGEFPVAIPRQPALGDLRKGLVVSLCNHTSVVWYDAWPALHHWV
jgi:hypothetical protein